MHTDPGFPLVVGSGVSIGHRAVLHGCTVEDDVLIGMGAVLLNGSRVGRGSLIAAGAVLLEGTVGPSRLARGRRAREGATRPHPGRAGQRAGQREAVRGAGAHVRGAVALTGPSCFVLSRQRPDLRSISRGRVDGQGRQGSGGRRARGHLRPLQRPARLTRRRRRGVRPHHRHSRMAVDRRPALRPVGRGQQAGPARLHGRGSPTEPWPPARWETSTGRWDSTATHSPMRRSCWDPCPPGHCGPTSLMACPHWPLVHRLGVLSNVDDELFASTRAARLVDPDLALTSQRLQAYKPGRRIYDEARRLVGPMVHIASSARDVRGAIEAGVMVIRLRRPGHELDPEGPTPEFEVDDISELAALLERMSPGWVDRDR